MQLLLEAAIGQLSEKGTEGESKALEDAWADRTEMLSEGRGPMPLNSNPSCPVREGACCRFGYCVCRGRGLDAFELHRNLVTFLKPYFRPRRRSKKRPLTEVEQQQNKGLKAAKHNLERGYIVLRLQALSLPEQDAGWAGLAEVCEDGHEHTLDLELDVYRRSSKQEMWLHISYTELKLWLLAGTVLHPAPERSPPGMLRLELPLRPEFGMTFQLWGDSDLDFSSMWAMSVYRIIDGEMPMRKEDMAPNHVYVEKVPNMPAALRIWQGSEAERRRRASKPAASKSREAKKPGRKRPAAKSGSRRTQILPVLVILVGLKSNSDTDSDSGRMPYLLLNSQWC